MEGYKDTEMLAKECDEAAVKTKYNCLVQTKNRASTERDHHDLAELFRGINGYKNSTKLARECDNQYQALKNNREEQERIERERQTEQERIERERHEAEERERRRLEESKRKTKKIFLIASHFVLYLMGSLLTCITYVKSDILGVVIFTVICLVSFIILNYVPSDEKMVFTFFRVISVIFVVLIIMADLGGGNVGAAVFLIIALIIALKKPLRELRYF